MLYEINHIFLLLINHGGLLFIVCLCILPAGYPHFFLRVYFIYFMDRDGVEVHKLAEKERTNDLLNLKHEQSDLK